MATPVRVGLYLADRYVFLAESDPKKLQTIASSEITSGPSSQDVPLHSDITEEIHVVSAFQRLLRENKIESASVCVSLPIEEIFLRSFVIPWMPASELNNVVFYEAKKYVPFDLKLLEYVYESFPFTENKQKRLRVIFYAVRKQTLEKYERIFKQTGCKAIVYESSLVSLAKYLISRKQMRMDQKTVVIYVRENYGQIIFYERGVAYFVREFSLSTADVQDSRAIPDVLRSQLLREVRKSFGYYSRQFSQEKIKEVLIVSAEPDETLAKQLTEEFSVKVKTTESSVKSAFQKIFGLGALCACGASLAKFPSNLPVFNFLQSKTSAQSQVPGFLPPSIAQFFKWDKKDFTYSLQALAICAVLLIGGFFYGQSNLQTLRKKINELTLQQGELANKSLEEIDAEIKLNQSHKIAYDKMIHDTSHMTSLLIHLTQALSEGIWLDEIDVQNNAGKLTITIQGYITLSSTEGAQFRTAQGLILRLNNDEFLSAYKFKLATIQRKKTEDREAFYFMVTGS